MATCVLCCMYMYEVEDAEYTYICVVEVGCGEYGGLGLVII